jgi:adenine specific DNA methylase Mod
MQKKNQGRMELQILKFFCSEIRQKYRFLKENLRMNTKGIKSKYIDILESQTFYTRIVV